MKSTKTETKWKFGEFFKEYSKWMIVALVLIVLPSMLIDWFRAHGRFVWFNEEWKKETLPQAVPYGLAVNKTLYINANGVNYEFGLREDGVVVWRKQPFTETKYERKQ